MTTNYELTGTPEALMAFVLAGKAIFTLQNDATGNRVTYKVTKSKGEKPVHFVKVLTGPNNYENYTYMGTLFDGSKLVHTSKSQIGTDAMSFKALAWMIATLSAKRALPPQVHFYHEGLCCKCGKRLTVPSSILSGIGPECAKKM